MDFETTNHGGRFATTISGAVTGRGADWIIIDDPLKPIDAFSDTQREKVNDLYGNTVNSRLNNKNTGRILVVMQRLHAHDLSGFLFENDPDFKSIVLPLIAEKDEKWQIKNRITKMIMTYERKKGELLHPEREGEKVVNSYRNSMSSFVFSAQYQQNPMPIDSGMIKKEWMQYYQQQPYFAAIILSWDTATKTLERNAYSACVVLGIGRDQKYYLLEVFRSRLDFPELTRKVLEMSDKYEQIAQGRTITLIEDASSGTSLYQTLKGRIASLKSVFCKGSKEQRFNIVTLKTEQGDLLFPGKYESWFKNFEDEFLTFPNSLFKDQCDALSQALNYSLENYNQVSQNMPLAVRADMMCGMGGYNTGIEELYSMNNMPYKSNGGYAWWNGKS
ncbi:MAG: phage terminase large subunit [Alphaproteobacteria bacterium]